MIFEFDIDDYSRVSPFYHEYIEANSAEDAIMMIYFNHKRELGSVHIRKMRLFKLNEKEKAENGKSATQ